MNLSKVGAAVAVALAGSSAAHAIDPGALAGVTLRLTVAGASAARDSFLTALVDPAEGICASDIDIYRASPTSNRDFRAYTCVLKAAPAVPAAIANQPVIIYYRAEGGSAWGPVSIATNTTIKRLEPSAACTSSAVLINGQPTWDCAVTAYNLTNDQGTGAIVDAQTDLGTSDEEPKMYVATNYPSSTRFPTFNGAIGNTLRTQAFTRGYSQIFGVLLNTTGSSTSAITNLSKADVAAIFAGDYTDWSQVPQSDNGGFHPAGQIVVCRREPGSGTQVGAAAYFLNVGCGASYNFVADTAAGTGDGVVENGTTSSLEACVSSTPNAIGFNILKTTPISGAPNARYINIDGKVPSVQNAVLNQYDYWYEMAYTKRPGLTGNPNVLADAIINVSRTATTVPTTPSTFAIPRVVASNVPAVPFNAVDPVGTASRNGNSCLPGKGAP